MRRLSPLAVALLMACPAFALTDAGGPTRTACARVAGLSEPLAVASELRALPREERRSRLVARLSAEMAQRSRTIRVALREGGAAKLRVLWSAGVVCGEAPEATWSALEARPEVLAIFDDPAVAPELLEDESTGPNPNVPPEAPLLQMRVPEAWAQGYTGRGVLVAHIDTGVDYAHADLADHVWVNEDEVPGNGLDDDGNGFVDDVQGWNFSEDDNQTQDPTGHGTSTAGLLAGDGQEGVQTGVAPDVTIMPVRRGVTQSALWACSQYAIENGARLITQSNSWKWSFGADYAAWRRQTDSELAVGILHINSGGNTGLDSAGSEPIPYNVAAPANSPPPWHHPDQSPKAGLSSVIGVGNVSALTLEAAPRSPYGPSEWTDIAANFDPGYPHAMPIEYQDYPVWDGSPGLGKPDLVSIGEDSTATQLGGGYRTFGGTSAATPRVAGIAALMLQAVPDATPAELAEALLSTARDLGPVGRDLRHGAGLPDAASAIEALGPPLSLSEWEILDAGGPRGDGDDAPDEGEINRLRVALANSSTSALEGVELVLESVSGVRVRDAYARLASVPAGGVASTPSPHFGVEFLAGSCGDLAEMTLEIRHEERVRRVPILVRVGSENATLLIDTDFESPAGFSVSGGASAGAWVREEPVGTSEGGLPANPPSDASPDSGTLAWITGNGPTDPFAADVDGGSTLLTSPARDARAFARVELEYARWFRGSDFAGTDRLIVEARADSESAWTLVEEVVADDPSWRARRVVLSDLLAPGEATEIRFVAEDAGGDHLVEAGLDEFVLRGVDVSCTPFSLGGGAPSPLGATLRLAKGEGGHLELSWDPPSASGGEDPAAGYRVTRSADPAAGFEEIGLPALERFVELGGLAPEASPRFYLVEPLDALP